MADDLPEEDLVAALGLDPAALLRDVVGAGRQDWQAPEVTELEGAVKDLDFVKLLDRGGMGAVYEARQVSAMA